LLIDCFEISDAAAGRLSGMTEMACSLKVKLEVGLGYYLERSKIGVDVCDAG
jgi:hypothetical protein